MLLIGLALSHVAGTPNGELTRIPFRGSARMVLDALIGTRPAGLNGCEILPDANEPLPKNDL